MNTTIDFYNKNASEFSKSTVSVNFRSVQDKFLGKLYEHTHILDFGCGAGRDTKYF